MTGDPIVCAASEDDTGELIRMRESELINKECAEFEIDVEQCKLLERRLSSVYQWKSRNRNDSIDASNCRSRLLWVLGCSQICFGEHRG